MNSQLRFPTINLFLIASSILIGNASLMSITIPNINLITLIVIGLWYLEVLIFENRLAYPTKFVFMLFGWWVYELVLYFIGVSSAAIGNYYITLRFFDLVLKAVFVLYFYSNKEKRLLATFIYISIFATIVENLYYLRIYGDYYRDLYIQATYTKDNTSGINFASTAFYNSLIFFIGISFHQAIYSQKKLEKLFHFGCIAISYLFMLSIETRAISLFLSFLIIVLVYYNSRSNQSRKLFYIFLFLIVGLLSPLWIPMLIDILPERVAGRLQALLYHNSEDDEGFLSRFQLMSNSINTFLSSKILFGVGDHRGHEYWHIIGQHSQIFDDMARYGILGLIFLIKFFRCTYRYFTKFMCEMGLKPIAVGALIVFFVLCINSQSFNPAPGLTAFLLMSTIIPKND